MLLSSPLNVPLYGASTPIVGDADLPRTNVAIAGHQYLVDLMRYQTQILPATTRQFDQGAEVSERSLNREGFWTREQTDWHRGAGQETFDGVDADRHRFWTSKGIDPWTRGQLCLHRGTEQVIEDTTATNMKMLSVGGFFYLAHGDTLSFGTDPGGTLTDVVFANDITDITTDGDQVFVAFGAATEVEVGDVGSGMFAAFGTATATIIEYSNGRLIGAEDNSLFEIDGTGAVGTTIRDDGRSNFEWVAIAGHPQAIFAAGSVEDIGEFWATTVNDSGDLAPATFAGHLPFGETPLALQSYAQVVMVGTSDGLRGAVVSNLSLEYGDVIEVGPVRDLDVRGRFCWFTWTNYDGATTGLGRADVSVSTSERTTVPAYASDLLAEAQGTVAAVVLHGGDPYFAVTGSGAWGPTAELVEDGVIDTGEVRYSVLPHKAFTGLDILHRPLDGSVSADVVRVDGTTQSLGLRNEQGAVESSLKQVQASGRSVSLQLSLHRHDSNLSEGPCLRAWILHALPRPRRIVEWIVPLIIRTRVTDLLNRPMTLDPLAEVKFLRGLASSAQLVNYQEGAQTYVVRVDNVIVQEEDIKGWQYSKTSTSMGELDRTWFELNCTVRLLGREE